MLNKPWDINIDVYKNEEDLLAGLRRNEQMACTCMLKRFAHRLYIQARRLVNDDTEAEEILQESFIQACSHISRFEGKSSLNTWLYRIVTNAALMQRRRKSPETLSLTTGIDEEQTPHTATLIDETHLPDEEMLQTEVRAAIHEAIRQLPDPLREAFILRHVEGLSTKAAAAQLSITESALKVRLHRARQALRSSLITYQ